jgi:hypothetical protein
MVIFCGLGMLGHLCCCGKLFDSHLVVQGSAGGGASYLVVIWVWLQRAVHRTCISGPPGATVTWPVLESLGSIGACCMYCKGAALGGMIRQLGDRVPTAVAVASPKRNISKD